MTRALAVVALVGCACGQSPSHLAAPTCPACPTCPAVPGVDLALCPVERPGPPIVVTEPADDSYLVHGSGFWCTDVVAGVRAGESECFRVRKSCERLRRRARKPTWTTECRLVERARCMKFVDYKIMAVYYVCVPSDHPCEAQRASMLSRDPDLVVSECREVD